MQETPTATFSKSTLTFPLHPRQTKNPEETVLLTNVSSADLAFKVKTNNVARYYVRPNSGAVPYGETITLHMTLQPYPPCPSPGPSSDKFLVQTAVVPGLAATRSPQDYWQMRGSYKRMSVTKLAVQFARAEDAVHFESPPPPPRPRASSLPTGAVAPLPPPPSNPPPPTIATKHVSMPNIHRDSSSSEHSRATSSSFKYHTAPPGPLRLERHVVQLRITRPPHLAHSTVFTLANASSHDIFFRLKTTNSARYIIRPALGAIKSNTSVLIMLSLQPCQPRPEVGHSGDRLLILTCHAPKSGRQVSQEFWRERERGKRLVGYDLRIDFVHHEPQNGLRKSMSRSLGLLVWRFRRPRIVSSDAQAATGRPWSNAVEEVLDRCEDGQERADVAENVRLLQKVLDAKNLQVAQMENELRKLKAEMRMKGMDV